MRSPCLVFVLGTGLLLADCASSSSSIVSDENLLAAAGFHVLAGNTQGYAAAQRELPPHEVARRTPQNVPTYYYFDPTVCGCLYYGSQANWDAYNQGLAERRHMQAQGLLERANTQFTGQGY